MRRFLFLCTAASAMAVSALANPLCTSNDNLQNYINNYATFANACQIGDKLFWGFSLTNQTGFEPPASGVQVQPMPMDGITNVGISFVSGGWIADPGFPIDAFVGFNVATASGAPIIEDATLKITGNLSGTGGSANITETLTPSVPGSPLTATLPGPVSDHITFLSNMQSSFHVQDEINLFVNPESPNGGSHVSIVENDFSENIVVPEPVVSALFGSGLLSLGLLRRRRANR